MGSLRLELESTLREVTSRHLAASRLISQCFLLSDLDLSGG
jgi:hypothetical protein